MKKRIVTRVLATALTLGLAAAAFTGCSSNAGSNSTTASGTNDSVAANSTAADSVAADTTSDFDTSKEITVISREDGSGTRGAFIEITGVEQKDADGNKIDYTTEEAVISNSTNEVLTTVAGDTYAIGYISLGSLNDTVKAVTVDGVEATAENVANGTYSVQRPFNIATLENPSEDVQDFMAYLTSADAQPVIEENGYISAAEGVAYESNGATGSIVVGGSSSVSPLMEKLIESYAAAGGTVSVELQTSDSSTGMSGAADGTYDIGMASRELKDTELETGLQPTVLAKDGIAIVVNTTNTTSNLTLDQIKTIYTGDVTTWKEVQ